MRTKWYSSTLMIMVLLVGAFVMGIVQDANALFVMVLDDPGQDGIEVIMADNAAKGTDTALGKTTVADADGLAGFMNYIGAAGTNFTINVSTGISKPILGSPQIAAMDLAGVHLSSVGAGTLDIYLTDTDFLLSSTCPNYLLLSQMGGTADSSGGTVSYKQYVDLANQEFGDWIPPTDPTPSDIVMVSGGPLGPGAFSDTKSKIFAATSDLFSLTEYVSITHTDIGNTSFNIDSTVSAVPEPTTLLLLGFGLAGMAGYAWRRKKKQS
jgi:hypothetical protein